MKMEDIIEVEIVRENQVPIENKASTTRAVISSIEKKIRPMPSTRCSIFKVPRKFLKVNKDAYMPEIISIGPFHRGKNCLQAMEKYKEWSLHALLSRISSTPEERAKKLEELITAMSELEEHSRQCYSEQIDLPSNEFWEMMLVDGCFIIELFRTNKASGQEKNINPIFTTVWMIDSLRRDLILLENQLPFLVLEHLFQLTKDHEQGSDTLIELAMLFFKDMIASFGVVLHETEFTFNCQHLLHLIHNSLLYPNQLPQDSTFSFKVVPRFTIFCTHLVSFIHRKILRRARSEEDIINPRKEWEYIHCAVDLREAGVTFKRKKKARSLLEISFSRDGVLKIPPLKLEDYTDPLLRNLVALEQCNVDYLSGITSYIALLDSLISSKKDVRLLRRRGIIDCGLDDHEDVATVINRLCDGVMVKNFQFSWLCHKVNAYFRTDWHKWQATLKQDYFRNPWKALSILVAVLLLVLTLAQTIFSVLSYLPSHPG